MDEGAFTLLGVIVGSNALTIIAGLLWIERRITRIERDVHWLTQFHTRRERATDNG